MADETELKLELVPAAAAMLLASDLLPAARSSGRLQAIYFDTVDHRLAKAGLSLRIRRSGRRRVQTVKADGGMAAGLFARREWERTVADDVPVIGDATPIPALLGADMALVVPVFVVKVVRTTWDIVDGDTRIELVLDQGQVIVGARQAPVCEIELELKAGDPAALFHHARRIAERVPMRLGVLSKAERGYALAGPAAGAFGAVPIALPVDSDTAQAFRPVVLAGLRQFRLNEPLVADGGAEAVHQARVALRRVRSAFRLFAPIVGDGAGVALRRELRWLTAELGKVRDLDVVLAHPGAGTAGDRLRAERAVALDHLVAVLDSARVRTLLFDLAQWISDGGWLRRPDGEGVRDGPARSHAIVMLDRYRRKVKRGGRDLARIDDDARHALRKDARTLRHAAEFFAGLFPSKRGMRRHRRFVRRLEALQDRLGLLNDQATMPGVLARIGIAEGPEASALLAGGGGRRRVRAAAEAWDAVMAAKRFWR